ncbi:MAG: four-carbon acid sugar kinase family protein [Acetobacteraceae bacterium]|nr:four-carbon acid sugar kinase family protein [Acetobacteraceae bacterium]
MLLGAIADDFTGATDLASMLVRNGMRTVQLIGVPKHDDLVPDADAVVVALKSRTAPVAEAVADSLASLAWLRQGGARQFFFKYCSTFDSTDRGNIGPVADVLLDALGARFAIACPAFPANGRTIYQGYLFVGGVPLNESGMEHHPLTPMTDPNLVRVLGRQTSGRVGLVSYAVVARGSRAICSALGSLEAKGYRYAIVDAISDEHLVAMGEAAASHALITGGSGVAMGLPENLRRAGLLAERFNPAELPMVTGASAVLAGSCSRATLGQIEAARAHVPVLQLDPLKTPDAKALAAQGLDWARGHFGEKPVVIAASAPPERVAALQERLGRDAAGALVEHALASVAEGLFAAGVRRLVVAGGETSGAIVARLGVRSLRIGAEIDTGVPWTYAEGEHQPMWLALKSGNFGSPEFFTKAFGVLG